VPATLQAAIGARIDRLDRSAKRTLSAAAVIGSSFSTELLTAVGVEPALDQLVDAELIDEAKLARHAEYAFRHPLIRAVAYESQLKADRAEWHRRVAAAIEDRAPESAEENAALIAEHLQAADDLRAAYGWRMRAGAWSTTRDITAARVSWECARKIADALPVDEPDRTPMRIAPRTMLCVSSWRGPSGIVADEFDELRELCAVAGDKASLAIAMTGLITEFYWHGRMREASRLASEQMALLESIGNPILTIGTAYVLISVKFGTGEIADALRLAQTVIDLADGDPAMGGTLAMGSPLAGALAYRGAARYCFGHPGWRDDLDNGVAMARSSDAVTHALVVAVAYGLAIVGGVLRADDATVGAIEEALHAAEGSSGDSAVGSVKFFLGCALTYRDAMSDRERGLEMLAQVSGAWLREGSRLYLVPAADVFIAREKARRGDCDGAISLLRRAADELLDAGELTSWFGAQATLAEALLGRGADDDLAEAEAAIDRSTTLPALDGFVLRDITLLRLRALLARRRGDEDACQDLLRRYRAAAESLGFEGHIAMADEMA
jgi:hypothetical protein